MESEEILNMLDDYVEKDPDYIENKVKWKTEAKKITDRHIYEEITDAHTGTVIYVQRASYRKGFLDGIATLKEFIKEGGL